MFDPQTMYTAYSDSFSPLINSRILTHRRMQRKLRPHYPAMHCHPRFVGSNISRSLSTALPRGVTLTRSIAGVRCSNHSRLLETRSLTVSVRLHSHPFTPTSLYRVPCYLRRHARFHIRLHICFALLALDIWGITDADIFTFRCATSYCLPPFHRTQFTKIYNVG